MKPKHDVVISGISGLFPESEDIEVLCDNLYNKVDMVTIDHRRWPPGELGVPTGLGKIQRDQFDYGFFGISQKLAQIMDPTTKLSVEQAFRAVCDSGMSLKDLSGSNSAVFMSSFTSETEDLFLSEKDQGNYGLVAHSRTMQANRISFFLNFKGPSVAVDATWGGGIEALQMAYDCITTGECVAAIVGSSSLLFAPHISRMYQAMGRLSEDSVTRCFSSDANGYARSEGCVALFLQRADHAKRSYGTVLGVHTLNYGSKLEPFTEFSEEGYKRLLKGAYSKANVRPEEVAFVEANGVASKAIDAKELNAISEVLLPGRRTPLLIGSVKSNLGHTEAAASLVSLTKAVIAMDKGFIPPNLNYDSPNPDVPALVSGKLQVVTEKVPLTGDVVGVSSIGVSGPYSHVVLKRNPKPKRGELKVGELPPDGLPRLVLLTDRNPENIVKHKKRLEEAPIDVEFVRLMNNFAKDGVRNHLYRGYTVLNGTPNNYNQIDAYSFGLGKRPVWYIFSGMGSQWPGMGKSLMRLPVFAAAIRKCHETLLSKGLNLIDAVTNDDPKIFDNILNAFVGIAAVQIALVDVLRSVGVEPDGIVGHSLGEQGCGYADGCFTTEQMILSAYARGKASLDAGLIKGMMAAVGKGYQEIQDQLPGNVEIACHNSKDSCTLSGPAEEVAAFIDTLKAQGIFAKLVNVGDIAFHSKYMKPAGELLVKYLGEVIPKPNKRTSRWVSSSNPECNWDTELAQYCSAEYHANNMLSPVLFDEATSHIPADAIVIEIAPHALLQAIVKRSIPTASHVPLTSKFDDDGLMFLLSALGKLYVGGVAVQADKLYPPVEFPVSRGTPFLSTYIGWDHKDEFRFIRAKTDFDSCWKELSISLSDDPYRRLASHKLGGKFVIPDSFYLENIIEMFTDYKKSPGSSVVIENLKFENTCEISFASKVDILFKIQIGTGEFCITESKSETVLSKGKIKLLDPKVFDPRTCKVTLTGDPADCELDGNNFLSLLKYQGLELDNNFASVKKVYVKDNTIQAVLVWNGKLTEFLNSVFSVVGFLDAKKSCKLLFLKAANELIIDPSTFLNRQNLEVVVEYNANTRFVQCNGMRMLLPVTKQPILQAIQEIGAHFSCEVPQFIPFNCPRVKSISLIFELCTQVVLENAQQSEDHFGTIKVALIGYKYLNELSFIARSPKYSGKLELTTFESEEAFLSNDTSILHQEVIWIISPAGLTSTSIQSAAETSLKSFFLLPNDKNSVLNTSLEDISTFTLGQENLALVSRNKLNYENQYEVVKFNGIGTASLAKKLSEAHEKNSAEDYDRHFVILAGEIDSVSSAIQLIDETSCLPNHHLLRYLLVDDSISGLKTYSAQIQKNLKVNIKLSGIWGTLRMLPVELNEELIINDVYSGSPVYPISRVAPSKEIIAIGLNLSDPTGSTDDDRLSVFDYATLKSMGLASYDPISNTFTKDDIFEWKRPDSWSDTEVASVPALYALASYIVHVINNPSNGSSILINRGLIPLSQALISIALGEKMQTFVTVYGDEEKKTLLYMFPNLKEENIFDCSRSTFHTEVLTKTKGKGVYKVVNTFPEDVMIEPCVKCTGVLGTYVQVSLAPMINNSKMGMLFFDDEVVAMGATMDILMNLPAEYKIQIRDFVQKALKNGHVKLLDNRVILSPHSNNTDAVQNMKQGKSKVVVHFKPNDNDDRVTKTFVCDSGLNYVIIGGQPQSEFWLKLAEWLLRRGARRISVVLKQPALSPALSLRLTTLNESFPSSRIHLHSTKQINSAASINHLVTDLESSVSLCMIFMLGSAVKDCSDMLHQVLHERGLKCGLICLGNGGERLCERRRKDGLRSLCVRCSPTVLETFGFLQRLDELLINCKKNTVVTVNRYSLQNDKTQDKSGIEWTHVPSSLPELYDLLRLSSTKTMFVEVPTGTPRRARVKEIDPVFIIPGLKINQARRIAQRLYYPALIARLPYDTASIDEMASDLVEQMSKMPQKLFTLIADDWGGTLALNIASKLQLLGRRATVLLLDAAPQTTRNWAVKLMNDDLALIKKYMRLTPKVMFRLKECSSWEKKIGAIVECSSDPDEIEQTVQGLTLLRNRLKGVMSAEPPTQRINVQCHLFRYGHALKNDQCSLNEYLRQKVAVHVLKVDNPSAMIDEAMDDINTLVLFEYKDAAYPPNDNTIGIGFESETAVTLPTLTVAYSVLS